MSEVWQRYDEQGRPIPGAGVTKDDAYSKAPLHAASRVWIWRRGAKGIEILLQKRAKDKRAWPGRYDVSASGHIDLGEDPIAAAIRETKEEIGLVIKETDLHCFGVHRNYQVAPDKTWTENEFCWLYALELKTDSHFILKSDEVESLVWKLIDDIRHELSDKATRDTHIPRSPGYYELVFDAIKWMAGADS